MRFTDATFEDQTIVLDGNTFERCIFKNVVLRHEGGPFEILGGFQFNGSLNFDLAGGEATVKLIDMMGRATGYIQIGGVTYRRVDNVADQGPGAGQQQGG